MATIRPEHNKMGFNPMGLNPWEYQRIWEQAIRAKEESERRQKGGQQSEDGDAKAPHPLATLFPMPLPMEWFVY